MTTGVQIRTPLPVYAVGTIAGNAGSPVITGTGTLWTTTDGGGNTVNVVMGGDMLVTATAATPIRSVDSASQITLELALSNTINPGSSYRIIKYQPNLTGGITAALAALQNVGSDLTPNQSMTIDNGAGRLKFRVGSTGDLQIAVGPSGAVDSALMTAIDISQNGTIVDAYSYKKAINSLMPSFGSPTAVDAMLAFTEANNSTGSNAFQAATSNIGVSPGGDFETLVVNPWLASLISPPTIAQIRANALTQTR